MAFSAAVLRRLSTAASVLRPRRPFSSSAIASSALLRRAHPGTITLLRKPPSFLSLRFASSKVSADENLKKVLESEIQCANEDESEEPVLPDDMPFEIIDNPGDQAITLKREFAGENIQVSVFMNLDDDEDANDVDDDDDDDDRGVSAIEPNISMVVMIEKGEGPHIEFCCNLAPSGLTIESMSMKELQNPEDQNAYEGPEYSDLDDNLQAAFYKYLEVRGIKSSLYSFLTGYMMNKDEREYKTWLENMKKFLEK